MFLEALTHKGFNQNRSCLPILSLSNAIEHSNRISGGESISLVRLRIKLRAFPVSQILVQILLELLLYPGVILVGTVLVEVRTIRKQPGRGIPNTLEEQLYQKIPVETFLHWRA